MNEEPLQANGEPAAAPQLFNEAELHDRRIARFVLERKKEICYTEVNGKG